MSTTWESRLVVPIADSRDHIQGSADAPVTLVEYGDFQCPYCGRAYQIVKEVQARMVDRLQFVFRNFPISTSHPYAEQAAEAAEAGGRAHLRRPCPRGLPRRRAQRRQRDADLLNQRRAVRRLLRD